MQPGYIPALAHGVPGNFPQVYNQSSHQSASTHTQFSQPNLDNTLPDFQRWRLTNQFGGYHGSNASMLPFQNYGFSAAPLSLGGYPPVPPRLPPPSPFPTYYGMQRPQATLTPQPYMQAASQAQSQYANVLRNNHNIAACSLPGNASTPPPSHITTTAYGAGFFPADVSTSATPASYEQPVSQFYQYQPSFPLSVSAPSHAGYRPHLGFQLTSSSNSLVSSSKPQYSEPQGALVGSRGSVEQTLSLKPMNNCIAQNTFNRHTGNSPVLSSLLQNEKLSSNKPFHETLRGLHSAPPVPFSVCESSVSPSNSGNFTVAVSKSHRSQNSPLPLIVYRNSNVSVNSNLECSYQQENHVASTPLEISKQQSHQCGVSLDIPVPCESSSVHSLMPGHQHALTHLAMMNASLSVNNKTDHFNLKTGPSVQAKRGRKPRGAIKRLSNKEHTESRQNMGHRVERLLNDMPTSETATQPLSNSTQVQNTLPQNTGVESSCQCTRNPLMCVLHNPLRSPVLCAESGDQVSASDPENSASRTQNPVNTTTIRSKGSPDGGVCDLPETDVDIMKETYTTVEEHGVDMYRTCLVCKETFINSSQLESHLSVHLPPETETAPSQKETGPLLQSTGYLDMPDVSGFDDISNSPLTPNSMSPINEQASVTNCASVTDQPNHVNECNENPAHGQHDGGNKSQQERCTETKEPQFDIIMESHDDNATGTEPQTFHTSDGSDQGSALSTLFSSAQVESVDKSDTDTNPTEEQQTIKNGYTSSPDHTKVHISHSPQPTHKLDNIVDVQMLVDDELPVITKKIRRDDGEKVRLWKPFASEQHRDKLSKSWNVCNGSDNDNLKTQTNYSKDTHSVSKASNSDNNNLKTQTNHSKDTHSASKATHSFSKASNCDNNNLKTQTNHSKDTCSVSKASNETEVLNSDVDKSQGKITTKKPSKNKRDRQSTEKRLKHRHGVDEAKCDKQSHGVEEPKRRKQSHGVDEPKRRKQSRGTDESKGVKRRRDADKSSVSVICADEDTHIRKSAMDKHIQHNHGINASSLSIQCAVEEMRSADFENSSSPKYLEPIPELKRKEGGSEKSVVSYKPPVSHKPSLSLKVSGHERKRSHKERVNGETEVKSSGCKYAKCVRDHQIKDKKFRQPSTAYTSLRTCSPKCKQETSLNSCVSGKEKVSRKVNVACNCNSTLSSLPNTPDRSSLCSPNLCEPSISSMPKLTDIAESSSSNIHEATASLTPCIIDDSTKPPTPNIRDMTEPSSSKKQNVIKDTPVVCLQDVCRSSADKSDKKRTKKNDAIVKSSSKLHKTQAPDVHSGIKHKLTEQGSQKSKATKKQTPDLASSLRPKQTQNSDSEQVHGLSPETLSGTKHTGGIEMSKPSDSTSTEHERQQSEKHHNLESSPGPTSSSTADPKSALGQRIVNSLRHLLKNKLLPLSSNERKDNHVPGTDSEADKNVEESSSKQDVGCHMQVPRENVENKTNCERRYSIQPQTAKLVQLCDQPTNTMVTENQELGSCAKNSTVTEKQQSGSCVKTSMATTSSKDSSLEGDIIFCVKCMTAFVNRVSYQKHGCCQEIDSEDSDSESEDRENCEEICSADRNGDRIKFKHALYSAPTLKEKTDKDKMLKGCDIDNNNACHQDKNRSSASTKLVSRTENRKMVNGKIKKSKKQCKDTSRDFHKETSISECHKKTSKPVLVCKEKASKPVLLCKEKDGKQFLCKVKKTSKPTLLCKIKMDNVRTPAQRKKSNSGQSRFRCDQCSQTYSSQGGLLFHHHTVHKKLDV